MTPRLLMGLAALAAGMAGTALAGDVPDELAFRPADEDGFYAFDTGVLRGKVRLNGRSQGITELAHVPSGQPIAAGGRLPGLFSYYRVLAENARYGKAARDWPTRKKILRDGALAVFWPAGEGHPLEMTAVYRFSAPDTLDVLTTVKPLEDMAALEIFTSAYFEKPFRARVYVTPPGDAAAGPRFVPVDRPSDAGGRYVMIPRDERALGWIRDGRWTYPPNPVDWDVIRWLAAPLVMRRDESTGLTALMMCPARDCFAVSSPWNPATPESGGYRSLYHSLFGRDMKAGQTAQARCRLVVARGISDREAVRRYERYLEELREGGASSPSRQAGKIELTDDDDGETVSVPVGARIEIALKGNPTTGYSWGFASIEGDAVEQMGKVEYRTRPHRPGMVGVGGTFSAVLKALKPGRSTVTLHYARPWEKDKPPARSFQITVRVGE
jgi:inhibitor of cysteine peptidase